MNLDNLKELASRATEGPWRIVARNKNREFNEIAIRARTGAVHQWATAQATVVRVPLYGGEIGRANAAYIASASPDVVLALIEVAEKAKALLGNQEWEHMTDRERDLHTALSGIDPGKE